MPSFMEILNLSLRASWLVLAVIAIRLLLKKAPKAFHCGLWALVAIRLLCPISIESELSLLPSREIVPGSYLVLEPGDAQFDDPVKLDIITNPVYDTPVSIDTDTTVDRVQSWDLYATILWLTGTGAMAIYAAYSYLSLRLRVRMAGWVHGRVWECDEIDSPFILGLLRPRIYLPAGLDEHTRSQVLAHENAHLKRLDHLWKPLGFVLLSIHWFNPLLWLAYVLLCRDIELACDEKVIRKLDKPGIRAYSEALVQCTVPHRSIALCPLAFGEVGVKGRIRTMLHYKKPAFWILVLALTCAIVLTACFLTDPVTPQTTLEQILNQEGCQILSCQEQTIKLEVRKTDLPENVLNGKTHRFDNSPILIEEYDNTHLVITEARMSGDELLITVKTLHNLPDTGSLLLLEHPYNDSVRMHVRPAHTDVVDAETVYGNAMMVRNIGPDSFSVGIQMEVWDQAKEYVRFQLDGFYHLRYSFEPQEAEGLDTVRIYTPKNLGGMLLPSFALRSDGTFYLSENALSSYMGLGTYTLEDHVLTLSPSDGRFTWVFTEEDGEFLYDAEHSSPITYYFDMRTPKTLSDGVRFTLTDQHQTESNALIDAINAIVAEHWPISDDLNHITTQAMYLLDTAAVSGTPLAGSTEHSEQLIVHMVLLCQTFQIQGTELIYGDNTPIHAAITFDTTGGAFTLSGIQTADEDTPLTALYNDTALKVWQENAQEILDQLEFDCAQSAKIWLQDNPPTEEEVAELISAICSSPAQSSNPGAYIEAHPEEYTRLVNLGQTTVAYCFRQFARGDQIGLEGHIMAHVCREIISGTEALTVDGYYMTGQDWFDAFVRQAKAFREELGTQELSKFRPWHAMALDILGI